MTSMPFVDFSMIENQFPDIFCQPWMLGYGLQAICIISIGIACEYRGKEIVFSKLGPCFGGLTERLDAVPITLLKDSLAKLGR